MGLAGLIIYALPSLLPPIGMSLLFCSLRPRVVMWQHAALLTMMAAVGLIVAINETLSLFHALARENVVIAWSLFSIVSLCAWLARRRPEPQTHSSLWPAGLFSRLVAITTIVILLTLLVIAITCTPNNWDSMSYHMARVSHWIQQRSIEHFPTQIGRQVFMPPLAEWIILHTMLLSGGDHLANVVQWSALGGCLISTSWIARQLGSSKSGATITLVFCLTIPMAILQATSTQNDLVNALFISSFVALGMHYTFGRQSENRRPMLLAIPSGLMLGFCLLTKGTAFIFVPPFAVMFATGLFGSRGWRAIFPVGLIAILSASVVGGHLLRNYNTCGQILGPGKEAPDQPFAWKYTNDLHSWQAVASNLLRDVSLQLGAPRLNHLTGILLVDAQLADWCARLGLECDPRPHNERVRDHVMAWHETLGIDPNHPMITWEGSVYEVDVRWNNEDIAASPMHTLLATGTLMLLPFARLRKRRLVFAYACCVAAMLVLFAGVLRWQVWHCRLMLPILVMLAPLAGTLLEYGCPRVLSRLFMILLLVAAIPCVINNETRPIFGHAPGERPAGMFSHGSIFTRTDEKNMFRTRDLESAYNAVLDEVERRQCKAIGLHTSIDDWEYPLWAMIRRRGMNVHIEHIDVTNETKSLTNHPAFRNFHPDVTVRLFGGVSIEP